jgi:hypothetical protein
MSDYTPTTKEVRTCWIENTEVIWEEGNAVEFDRWLESTLQETQIAERERIIKLLEANHLTAASELIEQDALGENQ